MRWTIVLAAVSAVAQPVPLTLKRAVEIALAPDGNARVALAREAAAQAEARERLARGALLPNLDSSFGYQNFTRNLAAFGVQISVPFPGFAFPSVVGPINTLDFRAAATQSVLDWSSLQRYRAAGAQKAAARQEETAASVQTASGVARAYVNALRADAVREAAKANLALAERLLRLARSQKDAGTGTGMDVTRAEVVVEQEKQRLLASEEDHRVALLGLQRTIGLPMAESIELADRLQETGPAPEAAALLAAAKERAELRAQKERLRGAQLQEGAAKAERLPSVGAYGDYGTIGIAGGSLLPTHTFALNVKLPVWDGGRREARRAEAGVAVRSERLRERDLERQIEYEVRAALASVETTSAQVAVAREALRLAQKEIEQAQRRYEAGVAASLELTDAQTRLARGRESEALALARYNAARVDLDAAVGRMPELVR